MAGTSEFNAFDARMAERRRRGARIWADSAVEAPGADGQVRPFRTPLGWLVTAILSVVLGLTFAVAVIVVPAGLDCRGQSARGFFAGDSLAACLGRTVPARFREFDGRVRRVILHSGQ